METKSQLQISDLKDLEAALAVKRVCNYLVDVGWHHDGDDDEWGAELRLAVARSKRHKEDVKMLSALDTDLDWGQIKKKVGEKTYAITGGGDFNPWYKGGLSLNELIDSMSDLADILESTTPADGETTEFLHFYRYLRFALIPADSLKKAPVKSIAFSNLHPKIKKHCFSRYKNGNYADAILSAYKVVFNEIKSIAKIHDLDNTHLIEKVFSAEKPIIRISSNTVEQKGFKYLLIGAELGIKNPKAEDLIDQNDELIALEYLSFASLLMRRIDDRVAVSRKDGQ